MSADDLDAKARAVLLLARGQSSDSVGQEIGVTGRTVRRWRDDPEFETEVQAARREVLAEAVAALGAAARDAVTTLHSALGEDSPNVRVRAASVLLGALPAISEHLALEERVAALEALVNGQGA